jgi:hypothetical protein
VDAKWRVSFASSGKLIMRSPHQAGNGPVG